jgi:MFS family permease
VVTSYGWVIVGVSATVNWLAWSMRSTFAVFYVALLAEFAWRRGEELLGLALALTGRVTTLWHYYLALGVLGGAGIACIQVPAATIVGRWFLRSRGAAMGIISAGSSAVAAWVAAPRRARAARAATSGTGS